MKRLLGAVLVATGFGIHATQATRTPIYAASNGSQTNQSSGSAAQDASAAHGADLTKAGSELFGQNCAFCHGRDAMGGETGPDLTRAKLVLTDKGGDKISEVVRDGRPQKGMPSFNFSSEELASLVAFIHSQVAKAGAQNGRRRGV